MTLLRQPAVGAWILVMAALACKSGHAGPAGQEVQPAMPEQRADATCGSPARVNGDTLRASLTNKFVKMNAGAQAEAAAQATASLIVGSFVDYFSCRVSFVRDDAGPGLARMSDEMARAFTAIAIVAERYPAGKRLAALDSAHRQHADDLQKALASEPALPLNTTGAIGKMVPSFDLITLYSAGAKIEFQGFVNQLVQGLTISAEAKQYAAQKVSGNARLAAQESRAQVVRFAEGRLRPIDCYKAAINKVYQIGEQQFGAQ